MYRNFHVILFNIQIFAIYFLHHLNFFRYLSAGKRLIRINCKKRISYVSFNSEEVPTCIFLQISLEGRNLSFKFFQSGSRDENMCFIFLQSVSSRLKCYISWIVTLTTVWINGLEIQKFQHFIFLKLLLTMTSAFLLK